MSSVLEKSKNKLNEIITKVDKGKDEYKKKYDDLVGSTAERDFLIASILSVIILGLAGLYPIKFSQRGLSYMHVAFGIVFVVSVIIGIYLQRERVKLRKRLDWVVWMHIVIFGIMAYLGVLATAKHTRKLSKLSGKGSMTKYIVVGVLLLVVLYVYTKGCGTKAVKMNEMASNNEIIATYKGNRYNLTEWAPQHPGGKHWIELANGKDLETLWNEKGLAWHMDTPYIMDILEKYKIE